MTNVFSGEPPAHIKNWMLTHTPYVYFGSVDGTHQHRTNVTELTGSYNWDIEESTGSQTCLVGNESVSNNNITYLSGDAACKCTSVGYVAFYNCQSLTSVSLPAVTSVGSGAFSGPFMGCPLTSVSL